MTRVIALANQKGGVGKTTTTLNLGAALAERGRRVLLIDIDPQANLTTCLGLNPDEQEYTIYEVLLNPKQGAGFAIQQMRDNLFLIPSTLGLAAAELELAGQIGREKLLHKALRSIRTEYDYLLIDPPPSLGLFTLNALAAATEVLIPLQVQILSLKAVAQLNQTILRVQEDINPVLDIGGVLCTMVDRRTAVSEMIETKARKAFGARVYQTTIPHNTQLVKATATSKPIMEYDRSSSGAVAYIALAEDVDRDKTA
jgi:chromosome partitioning protein